LRTPIFKDLRVSSSFRPEVPLLPDDLSEDYDEDPYFTDFDDSARRFEIKQLDDEEEVKEGDNHPPTNIAAPAKEE
jgi:hypothetical protein